MTDFDSWYDFYQFADLPPCPKCGEKLTLCDGDEMVSVWCHECDVSSHDSGGPFWNDEDAARAFYAAITK